ncbi:MAG: hypothetical protein OEN56_00755 [Gemmatimonadota bacterium]|nr:hypothetical protein [Gemmatimonadota bacterium]
MSGSVGFGSGAPAQPDLEDLRRIIARLRARTHTLRARPAAEIRDALGRVGARFLDEADELRMRALEVLPTEAHLSVPMARTVLDGMARDWTGERLGALLRQELGDPTLLDGLAFRPGDDSASRRLEMAVGPSLCVQIVSGSVPGVGVNALLRSLSVKAPTLLKPGAGDRVLPTLFAEGLRKEDPALADALAVVYWPGGTTELEQVVLDAADVAVVYGSDETVSTLRARAPATTRVVTYHHRVGVGIVGRDAYPQVVREIARSVVLFEQRGCVCPQLIYVERGGAIPPEGFALLLAEALEALERELPGPPSTMEDASALQQLRGTAEMMAGQGGMEVHHGGQAGSWSVLFEPEPTDGPWSGPRAIRVRAVDDASLLSKLLEPLGPHLQSVGYAGLAGRAAELAEALGRVGASRVVPFGALSFPPPWWLHDGRGPLLELLRWVELEGGVR